MSYYSENIRKDTASPLFDRMFLCRFPQIESIPIDQQKAIGTYSTGDKALDIALMKSEYLTTYINIDKMLDFFRRGVNFYIVNRSDTVKIYELISEHLDAWCQTIDVGLNIGNAPIEDLIDLDRLADLIYDKAKYKYKEKNLQDFFDSKLASINRFNAFNLFNTPISTMNKVESITQEPTDRFENRLEEQEEERTSLQDMLKAALVRTRR